MAEKFWVLCGKPQNWEIALKDAIWGLIPKFGGKWKYLKKDDWLFLYVTNPVSGVIGLGKVEAKFRQNKPLWPDEILQKKLLYPFRFEFQSEYVLPKEEWKAKRIRIHLPTGFYSGINLLDDQDIIDGLCQAVKQDWGMEIAYAAEAEPYKPKLMEGYPPAERLALSHDQVKDMIFEIGKMHRYISEKEYEINAERLDVVWRRVEKSVPTYAFEIQIGGDLYHALVRLKHAYDIWNSNIYIVIEEKHRDKVEELLAGTFHEIRNILNVVNLQQIEHLYSLQAQDLKLRKEVGLT
jgi:predicted RNA-binding protein